MSRIRFDELKKPTSIAKRLKTLCDFDTLKASKSALAELSGYSDWIDLKRCVSNEETDRNVEYIDYETVLSISKCLRKYTELDTTELTSWVALNFSFKPVNVTQLNVFITDTDKNGLNSHLNCSKIASELIQKEDGGGESTEFERQGIKHWAYTVWKVPSQDINPYGKLASLYFLASEHDCASAQVEFGRALISGKYGFKDLECGAEMLQNGLPFVSDLIFNQSIIVVDGDKEREQLRNISDWLLCSTAIFHSNRFDRSNYFSDLDNTLGMTLHWLDKLECTTDALKEKVNNLKAKAHYMLAQLAAMAIAEENREYLDRKGNKLLSHLESACKFGDDAALKLIQYFQSAFNAIDEGKAHLIAVDTKAEVMMQVAWRLAWSFHPTAKLMYIEPFLNNAIDDTQYYREHPQCLIEALEMIEAIKDSIERWPHLQKPLLSITDTILLQLYKNKLCVEKAVKVGISLFYFGDTQMIYNTVMSMKLNLGNENLVDLIEEGNCLEILDSVAGKSLSMESVDIIKAFYIEGLINRYETLSAIDIERIKELCQFLLDRNYIHPAFQLIFKLRESGNALELDWFLPWVEKIVTKITNPSFINHPEDENKSYEKIITELGLLNILNNDPSNAKKHWEMVMASYPYAKDMMSLHFGS
jgi:hypothetical protein